MVEEQPEKGTPENPLTREDVHKAIEENGGTTAWLDLSGKVFEDGIDLRGLNNDRLQGIILNRAVLEKCHLEGVRLTNAYLKGAFLEGAHLKGASLRGAHAEDAEFVSAHLQKACLTSAHIEGAEFFDAHLEESEMTFAFLDRTRLSGAHLQGVYLFGAKFSDSTHMESINWGDFILGEEREGETKRQEFKLGWAEDIYRQLKQWYANAGMYDIAGKFFYREMETKRKSVQSAIIMQPQGNIFKQLLHVIVKQKRNAWNLLWFQVYRLTCGYGERPQNVLALATSVITSLAVVYFLVGGLWEWSAFWRSLYFSAVSFTALGYGSWVDTNSDWMRGIGAAESFIGVFSMALFLITFTRKMTR